MTKHKQQKKAARTKSITKQRNVHSNNLRFKLEEVEVPVILPVYDSKKKKYVTTEQEGSKIKITKFAIVGKNVVKRRVPKDILEVSKKTRKKKGLNSYDTRKASKVLGES